MGMSVFDLLASLAFFASTWLIPSTDEVGVPVEVYGASGNNATCKAQGFFMELTVGSAFYNLVLSVYYYLVIVKGRKEGRLVKHEFWMHCIPIVAGLGFAFAGLPYYGIAYYICHVRGPPLISSWTYVAVFLVAPIAFVALVATVLLLSVYASIRRTQRRSARWRFWVGRSSQSSMTQRDAVSGSVSGSALDRQVLVQATFYLSAFYGSLAWHILGSLKGGLDYDNNVIDLPNIYWFYLTYVTLVPLQGFWNALTYFRLRLCKQICRRIRGDGLPSASVLQNASKSKQSGISDSFPKGVPSSFNDERVSSASLHLKGTGELPRSTHAREAFAT